MVCPCTAASGEWEEYSERLIDTGEMLSSAGGVRIVNEDDGDGGRMSPSRSNGLQDFEYLMVWWCKLQR